MPDAVRTDYEGRFGHDFSGVRIHHGAQAASLSRAYQARAFTVGSDIYFNRGEFNPSSRSGRHLLAHELTHVVQQQGGVHTAVHREMEDQPSAPPTPQGPTERPPTTQEAAELGREALSKIGYERLMQHAREAGFVRPGAGSSSGTARRQAQRSAMVLRDAATFTMVFTRYAVAAGVTSQLDSPAPGPMDLIALGILVWGLGAALIVSTTTRPACPPCPAPPGPEIDRVPPSRPHFPCPGDHWHYYVYNQNPLTCECFQRRLLGGCCGAGNASAPC